MKCQLNSDSNRETTPKRSKKLSKREVLELLTIILTTIGTICSADGLPSKIYDRITIESNTDSYQKFVNNETYVQRAGIDYVQYQLTCTPQLYGYQVKPYPYVSLTIEESTTYIPITNQFTQEQYTAELDGTCSLLRENNTPQIKTLFSQAFDNYTVNTGCIIAIEYVEEDNTKIVEVFNVKNGQLTYSDAELATKVLDTTHNLDTFKLDLLNWPYDTNQLKQALSN